MSLNINNFPAEVVRLILAKVKSVSRDRRDTTFLDALITCRLWHHIGEELLWTDISLSNFNLIRFCASSSTAFSLTRSLSIKIFPPRHGPLSAYWDKGTWRRPEYDEQVYRVLSSERDVIWRHLRLLASKIREMPQLESFSIRVCSGLQRFKTASFYLRGSEVRPLLDALGPSVRSVELDDHCYMTVEKLVQSHHESQHMCLSLKRLMPQLQNLRLRISPVCEQMFPELALGELDPTKHRQDHDPGGTVFINTIGLQSNMNAIHCTLSPLDFLNGEPEVVFKRNSLCDFLIPHVRSAIAQQVVANFAQFSLLDIQSPPERSRRIHHKIFDTVCERILGCHEKLRKTPLFSITTQLKLGGVRYLANNGETVEIIGGKHDIIEYCEGKAWVETVDNIRLANDYRIQHPRFQDASVKKFRRWEKGKLDTEPCTCRLWALEEEEGGVLVSGEILDDLNDVGCLVRKPTSKEIRREQRKKDIEQGLKVGDDPDLGTWGDTDSDDFNDGDEDFAEVESDDDLPELTADEDNVEAEEDDEYGEDARSE